MTTLFKKVREEIEQERLSLFEAEVAEKPTSIENRGKSPDLDPGKIHEIPIELIFANRAQPRTHFEDESLLRLADSIRQYGILQPISVRRADNPSGEGTFELIAGERRLRAAKLLKLEEVPCIIIEADDRRSAELALIENLQRESLNIFEQASSIASLIDIYELTQEEAARQLSVSQSFIANKLRILRLTAPERELILESGLTERHARALLKLESSIERTKAIEHIIRHGLNVAATEAYIERLLCDTGNEASPRAPRRIILKDIRLFYNTIDRAMGIVRQAGIDIDRDVVESDDESVVTIRIRKRAVNVSRET